MTKINILSQGRFHMLDLARELDHSSLLQGVLNLVYKKNV